MVQLYIKSVSNQVSMSGIWLGADSFSSYEAGIEKEWLVGNGLGGYASSTVIGAASRTYHGLLVAAPEGTSGRFLLLSSLDEELSCGEEVFSLAVHKYPGTVHPEGFSYLDKFSLTPFPVWVYRAGDLTVKKKVFMVYGKNTTVVLYEIKCGREEARLRIYPLVNARSFHATTRSGDLDFFQEIETNGLRLESSNGFVFRIKSNLEYHPEPRWYYNFEYGAELKRGLAFQEDNFNPGFFEIGVKKGTSRFFVASSMEDISSLSLEDAEELYTRAVYRQNLLAYNSMLSEPFALKLLRATDPFIVKHPATGEKSVIAGYPWFSDWGRDAMIALPGLTLVPRRFEDARSILANFSWNCRRGLIPNSFPALGGAPVYNTVDASLWFIQALGRYFAYTKDLVFLSDVWNTLEDIIRHYSQGTDFGIGMDSDFLIRQGPQLTWMDAKVDSRAVTPRAGKACEINALWYNALKITSELGELLDMDTANYESLAEGAASNFEALFWNSEYNCLFDTVSTDITDDAGNPLKDSAIRPNQILAVALPYTMLTPYKEKAIVDRVEQDLLTPFGLRTLSRDHPHYTGHYQGNPKTRDFAYHNGTVWPWLLGAYVKAYRKVHNNSKESLEDMRSLLLGFDKQLEEAGVGSISEVFDGDYPYVPGGCPAQAWSVAEILRAYVEDVLGTKP